jgi:Lar family restriction alleviation protein
MKSKLLSEKCPFCGSKDTIVIVIPNPGRYDPKYALYSIRCTTCLSQTGYYTTRVEAIDAWNRRVKKNKNV